MTEQASSIAREAKGVQQSLKEALKTREAWDKEVEFQRKSLRRHYLRLLLIHPYANESKDAETHLWMQTSYNFISIYKQRLSALDNAINSPPSSRNQPKQPRQGGHGPVEYRKLLQRFRQFLAEEEKFWSQLVVQFRRRFGLDEAHPMLVELGIMPSSDQLETNDNQDGSEEPGATTSNGRNQHQFPQPESGVSLVPQTSAERDSRLAIMSKALVCLGDIARYRELFNESGGRPKAGHEEPLPLKKVNPRKRGGGPGGDVFPRARDYTKALQCYEQARLLVPHEGNPSHQLAILATYKKDNYGSLVHYYRALCVRQPYDTALENLGTVLTKALDQWNARMKREKGKDADGGGSAPMVPRLRVEAFKEKMVVLHALWRLGAEKMDSISPNHAEAIRDDFFSLVSERGLPHDLISKAVILSQGALWKHRMLREATSSQKEDDPAIIEARILTHLLAMHETLLQVGITELAEAPPEENDLAKRITAIFRRTLPALRIASKWLKANFQYLFQHHTTDAKDRHATELSGTISQFWRTFSQLAIDLQSTFPLSRLPRLTASLEEDLDMKGFLPLRKTTIDGNGAGNKFSRPIDTDGDGTGANLSAEGQVHPNEEQLMRITDLLEDARTLKELGDVENLSILFSRSQFMVGPQTESLTSNVDKISERSKRPSRKEESPEAVSWRESDDDAATETTDDPVGDAFRQVIDAASEDDEGDEIIWDPRPSQSPASTSHPHLPPSTPHRASIIAPIKPILSPIGTAPRSPTYQAPLTSPIALPSPTTAEDLLNNVMGVSRIPGSAGDLYRSQHHTESSAPQPSLLFGSRPVNSLGYSIWSPSKDDQSLNFSGGNTYHSPPHHHAAPLQQDPKWHHNPSQSSQSHLPVASQVSPFSSPPHAFASRHQRTTSSPAASQLLAGQGQVPTDPLGYISTMSQTPQSLSGQRFPAPTDAYASSNINASHGTGLHYGPGVPRDYHRNHLHLDSGGMGEALAPPPLSPMWGGNNG